MFGVACEKALFRFYFNTLKRFDFTGKDNVVEMTIAGSQVRFLQSKIVKQEYQLLIKRSDGYERLNKTYPVIYFLDVQRDSPIMVST